MEKEKTILPVCKSLIECVRSGAGRDVLLRLAGELDVLVKDREKLIDAILQRHNKEE